MKGAQETRASQFKKGIEDKTRKRDTQALSLRKDRREVKLFERRKANVIMDENVAVQQLLRDFDPKKLEQGDVRSLAQLDQMMHVMNENQVEKYVISNIIPYIPILVRFCEEGNAEVAMSILLNLTSHQMDHDKAVADAIFKAGFVAHTMPRLLSFPTLQLKTRRYMWDVLSNLALTCVEARQAILASPLMALDSNTPSPFMQELKRLYSAQCTDVDRLAVIPQIVFTIAALVRYRDVPSVFCMAVWPFLLRVAQDIHPPLDDPLIKTTALYLYDAILGTFDAQLQRNVAQVLVQTSDMHSLLVKMREMLKEGKDLKHSLYQIATKFSGLSSFQLAFVKTRWDQLIVQGAEDGDPRVRYNAFLALGNYMMDGTQHVKHMIELGVVNTIVRALKNERVDKVQNASLYACLYLFRGCDDDRREGVAVQEAEGTMRGLVVQHNIFRYILPFLLKPGTDLDTLKNALGIFLDALEWDATLVKERIHDQGADTITQLLDQLNNAKGARDTQLYELASRADDLLQERGEMELDTSSSYFTGEAQAFFSF